MVPTVISHGHRASGSRRFRRYEPGRRARIRCLIVISAERTLRVDGLVNARDLGGLPRIGGGITPRGVFFRSENVDWITPVGWEQLHDVGIRTIVDLRQPGERDNDRTERPTWVTTTEVDLDNLDRREFWKDYWDNGLVGRALSFIPHLTAMPERAVAALSAIVSVPPGGVLFHCMGGRDRTGMISMLLLTAVGVEPEAIVDDYLETVRRGELRAASPNRNNAESDIELFCQSMGTSTKGAFRAALDAVDIDRITTEGRMSSSDRVALTTWRGHLMNGPS
jgi:protein-tyrosine phosphatase